jgi:hypothetical protein
MDDNTERGQGEQPAFDFLLGTQRGGEGNGPAAGSTAGEPVPFTPLTRAEATRSRRAAVDSRSLLVPLAITLAAVLVLGGAGFAAWSMVQSSEDQVRADSAAFCSNLSATPEVLGEPAFGWPTTVTDLPTSLEAMRAYQTRWETIEAGAPPTIHQDVTAVAAAAKLIADNVEATKTIDRATSLAQMQAVTSKTDIRAWYDKYCG